MFIAFLFILTMSDSRVLSMEWAGKIKNVYVLLFTLAAFRYYKDTQVKVKLHLYIIPFLLVAVICLAFSPSISTAAQKTLSYFFLFFAVPNYFSYIYGLHKEEFLKRIVWSVFFLLLIGLLLRYIRPDIVILAGRYNGLLGNPNGLGIYCFLFIMFFTIVLEFFPNSFSMQEKILIFGIAFISLLYCGARSSLVSVLLFYGFRYFHKLSPIFGFAILIVAIASYEVISNNLEAIIYSMGMEEYLRVDTLKDGSGRLVAWNFAFEQIEKNFYLGRGFSYTEYIFFEYRKYLRDLGHQGAAHNSYLTLWLDTGLVGLVTFLSSFLAFIFSISKLSISVFPLLYGALFSNQFESWITASLNPFTIFLLLSITLIFVAKKSELISAEEQENTTNQAELNYA